MFKSKAVFSTSFLLLTLTSICAVAQQAMPTPTSSPCYTIPAKRTDFTSTTSNVVGELSSRVNLTGTSGAYWNRLANSSNVFVSYFDSGKNYLVLGTAQRVGDLSVYNCISPTRASQPGPWYSALQPFTLLATGANAPADKKLAYDSLKSSAVLLLQAKGSAQAILKDGSRVVHFVAGSSTDELYLMWFIDAAKRSADRVFVWNSGSGVISELRGASTSWLHFNKRRPSHVANYEHTLLTMNDRTAQALEVNPKGAGVYSALIFRIVAEFL